MPERAGTKDARMLWKCEDVRMWRKALSRYSKALSRRCELLKGKDKASKTKTLTTLDAWMRKRETATGGEEGLEDLKRIMRWKLLRGKWRPLMRLVVQNSDATVRKCSKEARAFAEKNETKKALQAFCKLKGIGAATASAILAPIYPKCFAFMADECLETVIGKRTYTLSTYLRFLDRIDAKAKEMKVTCAQCSNAMWSCAMLSFKSLREDCVDADNDDDDDTSNRPRKKARSGRGKT